MMDMSYQAGRPTMFSVTAEEWQRRREAIWESALGPKAAALLELQMRRATGYRIVR